MSDRRYRLTRVALRQYKSIEQCDVRPDWLTVLVGPNGSGKSNFLDALALTSQALSENLDNALRGRGGVSEVRRRSTGHPRNFHISIEFLSDDVGGRYSFVVGAVQGREFRVVSEECTVTPIAFGAESSRFRVENGTVTHSDVALLGPVSPDRLYLSRAGAAPEFAAAFEALSEISVINVNPDAMRQPQKPDAGDVLRRDGSNIASVIERLQRERPEIKSRIEEYLGLVVTGLTSVHRRSFDAWESLEFVQAVAGAHNPWTFQSGSMSDGTLRALGVLAAALAPSGRGLFQPIGIEEPETALHPLAAGALLEALQVAAERRQVFVTTHSPDLLDSSSIHDGNLVAVSAEAGRTRIGSVDRAGRRALRERLYTAGELLRQGQLTPEVAPSPGEPDGVLLDA